MSEKPILVIGLGNPILGDDGIGWIIADRVRQALGLQTAPISPFDPAQSISVDGAIEIDRLSLGGLSLMERLIGYRYVILLDSIRTGRVPIGHLWTFTFDRLEDSTGGHTRAPHDASLKTALQVGRVMGADLPSENLIYVVAVETGQNYDFSDKLSTEVEQAVEGAVHAVCEYIKRLRVENYRDLTKETNHDFA